MIDGISGDAFSAVTLPPIAITLTQEHEEKVIRISRERYTNSRAEVEDKIRRWSGMLSEEEKRALLEKNRPTISALSASHPVTKDVTKESTVTSVTTPGASAPPRRAKNSVSSKTSAAPSRSQKVFSAPSASAPVFSDTIPTDLPSQSSVESSVSPESSSGVSVPPALSPLVPPVVDTPADSAEPTVLPVKVMYPTVCDTCGTDIEVPFKPDGKRPTFCRDCLRDYQRATAKVRDAHDRKKNSGNDSSSERKTLPHDAKREKRTETIAYVSNDRPIALSQVAHMEPRKIKTLRNRPKVDLDDVRSMISSIRDTSAEHRDEEL
jgi:CxxC-x17-CxxC domain-containing protein